MINLVTKSLDKLTLIVIINKDIKFDKRDIRKIIKN